MPKRLIVAAVAVLLVAAACGREGEEGELVLGGRTAPPAETQTPEATPQAPDEETDEGTEATPAPAGEAEAAAPPQPAPRAEEGGVNRPRAGRYLYDLEGESSDPFNPAAPPRRYEGEENTVDIAHRGDVTTQEQTSSAAPGRTTARTRWEAERVVLLSIRIQTAMGDFSCQFDPPPVIAKFPTRPETFPTQELSGQGNACGGKLDITVERQENANDAGGRSWPTWRVKVRTETETQQFTNTSDETRWVSPELGVEIRSTGTTEGRVRSPTGGQRFSTKFTTALKRRP